MAKQIPPEEEVPPCTGRIRSRFSLLRSFQFRNETRIEMLEEFARFFFCSIGGGFEGCAKEARVELTIATSSMDDISGGRDFQFFT